MTNSSRYKDKGPDIHALDLPALCRHAQSLQGQLRLADLTRLAASLFEAPAEADSVSWSAQASLLAVAGSEAQMWLALQARTQVQLQCQRCLQPMAQQLELDRHLRFVRDEDEAARLDEESDDDVLALPPRLDLASLLEDELILALPLVPRHEQCSQPLPLSDQALAESQAEDGAPHPFAALAALRRRGST
jgi:uncharacterized protein